MKSKTDHKCEFNVWWSDEDGVWIAEERWSWQIGTGRTPDEALLDAMKAVRQVASEAAKDPTLMMWHPTRCISIQQMA